MIEVIQINLHRSETATHALMEKISKAKIRTALTQEPWTTRNQVSELNHINYQLFYANTGTRPGTWFICHKETMASLYLPYDSPAPTPTSELQQLVRKAKLTGNEERIVCDANSHHISWGPHGILFL